MHMEGRSESEGWFARLPAVERSALYALGTARRYRPGATLFNEGDLSDWVVVVVAGRVKVSSTTVDGKEIVLAMCTAGELLGELSAIDASPRSATATAMGVVDVQVVPGDAFREFLASHPDTSLQVLRSFCGRLRDSDRRRVEFISSDSVGRVASRLVDLAQRFGVPGTDGSVRIDLPLTQDELAGLSGSSREAVGKALHLFRRRGWITTGRRSMAISNLDALRARAG